MDDDSLRATLTVVLMVPDADAMLVVPDACCFSHSFRGVSYADVELHGLESCLEVRGIGDAQLGKKGGASCSHARVAAGILLNRSAAFSSGSKLFVGGKICTSHSRLAYSWCS
ncbi:uncharacterized protein [Triticum aestivum]|uniref:uncharacterized protein n=1 Tax=Triticum aestivum TaxID=4565 RepID=UPI001D031DDF|nr:uncharacterized protein LOC123051544 [Triticum aestivum]